MNWLLKDLSSARNYLATSLLTLPLLCLCSNLNVSVAYRPFSVLHSQAIARILAVTSGARTSTLAGQM